MKSDSSILFVCREKKGKTISPIVKAQGDSLELIDKNYFLISGRGAFAYLKCIPKLRKHIKANNFSIIHAHYSFSGFSAVLAFCRPVLCSLMGSDTQVKGPVRFLIKAFSRFFWKATIVKSKRMKDGIGIAKAVVLPNGLDLDIFHSYDKMLSLEKTGFDATKKNIIFIADPVRSEKNFALAKDSVKRLADKNDVALHTVYGIEHKDISFYLNAADVLLLTSLWEGSPNVIKEAMACNCPIVSTDVGDVKEVIANTEGCYITSFEPEDVAEKLKMALDFGKRTNGRQKILHLDDKIIAQKLIQVYKNVINQ